MSPNGPVRIADFQRNRTGFGECCLSHGQPGVAAARGGLASSERDERLVGSLIFSWRFLGDFLEMPGSRCPSTEFQGPTQDPRPTPPPPPPTPPPPLQNL